MKAPLLKRILSISLLSAMLLSFSACSANDNNNVENPTESQTTEKQTEAPEAEEEPSDTTQIEYADKFEGEDLSYVMIYNPDVVKANDEYKEDFHYNVLSSGYFGTQIDVDIDRGEELGEDTEELHSYSPSAFEMGGYDLGDIELDRADGLVYDYEVGEKKSFYTGYCDQIITDRPLVDMECVYAGEYCYVWIAEDTDPSIVEGVGEEFDEVIYPAELELFGHPRFVTDEGGKVNLLFSYIEPDEYNNYVCGYFCGADLYSDTEIGAVKEYYNYSINTDHAIIHINTLDLLYYNDFEGTMNTVAHELQHLIMGSENLETKSGTWINETMSGYIQEYLYPGYILNGRPELYNSSISIRSGETLYKFDNSNPDLGRYGSVFYFSQYLDQLTGPEIFTSFHEYWRNSYSETLCDAEAIAQAIPDDIRNQLMNSVAYPENIEFTNEDDELISKLVLDFYLNTLNNQNDINGFDTIESVQLIYNDINATNIEAGGRIIVAVKDGEFIFPEDSDEGLIYVALDEDFEPIGYAYH